MWTSLLIYSTFITSKLGGTECLITMRFHFCRILFINYTYFFSSYCWFMNYQLTSPVLYRSRYILLWSFNLLVCLLRQGVALYPRLASLMVLLPQITSVGITNTKWSFLLWHSYYRKCLQLPTFRSAIATFFDCILHSSLMSWRYFLEPKMWLRG